MKRAQVWSLDFITSVIIFLLVLIPFFFVWSYITSQNSEQIYFTEIENSALGISDALIRTGGNPPDWNSSTVKTIGLASGENVLDPAKVNEFISMGNGDYQSTKNILAGNYDFYFLLADINGTVIGEIGNKPVDRTVVPVERYCLYGERIVKLELSLIS